MWHWLNICKIRKHNSPNTMKKFLIVGLGNVGEKYHNTRHNVGFKILNYLAENEEISFASNKLGDMAAFNFKGRKIILLKPST